MRVEVVSDVFVARQAIFDRENRLAGYELLHRASLAAVSAGTTHVGRMTGSVMADGLLGIGLHRLTGDVRAWVNFPRESLLRRDFDLLDPRRFVIELLESVVCDAETVAACRALRARGFTLALDDFAADIAEYAPILRLAQIVKISVLGETDAQLRAIVRSLSRFRVQLLAEKIEDKATFSLCRSLGFSLFQGYYFRRPEMVRRKDLPALLGSVARLMNLTLDVGSHDDDLEREFRADPGLSLKLLKIVNSAAAGGSGIESIHHAIRLVGRTPLYRWLTLLFATSVPRSGGVNRELVLQAVERGRFCELIAERSGKLSSCGSLFLTGLLSTFDAILGVPMPEILQQVRVSPDVEAALLDDRGPYAPYLQLATYHAEGNWEASIELGHQMGVVDHLAPCYAEASAWARDLLSHH